MISLTEAASALQVFEKGDLGERIGAIETALKGADASKLRELYVVGTEHALKFLHGGRALSSVMSRNNRLWADFQQRYGSRFSTVSDYYTYRKSQVSLKDPAVLIR